MTKTLSSVQELEQLTVELEASVPIVKGSFPDFRRLSEEWLQYGKRCSYYIFGTIKSGKSTLVNALVENDLLPRGSGVKTFSRARVVHHENLYGRVVFLTGDVLTQHFSHDFRILGFDVALTSDLFNRPAVEHLQAQFERFHQISREDGRIERIANREHQYSLLGLAYSRIERTLAGLDLLISNASQQALEQIRQTSVLEFAGSDFSQFRAWLDVAAYAPLIEDVEVGTPFPDHLPKDIEIVDCQGSDSLNPLDFASLDDVLHKTDQILYVINSRLGLREGDARLLAHLVERAAIEKMTVIINAEAHQPYDAAESNRLLGRTQEEFARTLGTERQLPKIYVVNGLAELTAQTDPSEASRIAKDWQRKGCSDTYARHQEQFRTLAHDVLGQDFVRDGSSSTALPSLIAHAAKTAQALLGRDEALLGVKAQRSSTPANIQAFSRIVAGEREAILQDIAKETWHTFDRSGPLQTLLQSFLKNKDQVKAGSVSLAEMGVSGRHGAIMANASEEFHNHWNEVELRLQKEVIAPLTARVKSTILEHLVTLHGMLPTAFTDDVLAVVGPWAIDTEQFLNQMKIDMDHLLADIARPVVLRPIVLPPAVEGGLAADFYARKFFGVVSAKVTGKHRPSDPKKARRLWHKTIDSLVKSARSDAQFSVSSCRENLKFQYYYKLVDKILGRIIATFQRSLEHHSETFARLASRDDILLSQKDRIQLQNYLQQMQDAVVR